MNVPGTLPLLSTLVCCIATSAFADSRSMAVPVLTLDAAATAPAMPRLVPFVDYTGDLMNRPALTGDWGGTRQDLMEKGVRLDISYTQIFQGNVEGGLSQVCTNRGGLDIALSLDTTYMGLWPGGMLKVKGESGWGRSNNRKTGALLPVDTNGIYPEPGDNVMLLPELNYTQFLAPFLAITLGKYEPRDANAFAHDETEQFLNAAFNFNPVIGTTVPTSFLGAGFIIIPAEGIIATTLALDTEGTASEAGFDTAFRGGTTLLQSLEFTVKPMGLVGHQRVSFMWTDKVRTQLDQNPRAIIGAILTGSNAGLAKSSGDWAFTYDFDQFLYMVPGSTTRGLGVFGRIGVTDGNVNPVEGFYSIGVAGRGLLDGRPDDSFGIGYYYLHVSRDLPAPLARRARDEQGMELYYNIAVTPWCHITPDLQIIRPISEGTDTAVVLGIRMKIDF